MRVIQLFLTLFLISFNLLANSKIDIKAWQLHHLDMDYCKNVIDKSLDYDINTIVLSHRIIGATRQLYGDSHRTPEDKNRGEKIRELTEYAKDKNLKVWIWTHELADVPEKFLKDGVVQMDKRGFWSWLERRYDQVFVDFPQFDGFMITFHETQYKIFDDNEVNSKLSMPDRFQKLINTINKACQKHDKELIVRTFVYEPEQLQWLKEGLEKTDDNVIVQSKCVPHDWQPFYPHNPVIGAFEGKRQIIEFDCSSEYTGRNHIPYTSPEYFSYRWKYDMTFPEVIGYNARVDHAGYDALFTPNEINLYTLFKVTENPEIKPDQIWQEWANNKYGEKAAAVVIEVLKPSFDIVNKLFFPLGVWFTNHTKLPPYNYAYNHINFINKWHEHEYQGITKSLQNPNLVTYQKVLAEKDTSIALTQRSLWKLREAYPYLEKEDYKDLNERITLLMQTGLIWKAHTEAFFGYLLTDQNPKYLPIVERAINQIKQLALIIPEDQKQKPVADSENIIKVANELQEKINSIPKK